MKNQMEFTTYSKQTLLSDYGIESLNIPIVIYDEIFIETQTNLNYWRNWNG